MMQIIVKRTFKPILFLLIIVVLVLVVLKVNSMDINDRIADQNIETDIAKHELQQEIVIEDKSQKFIDNIDTNTELIVLTEYGDYQLSHNKFSDNWNKWLTDSTITLALEYKAIMSIPTNAITFTKVDHTIVFASFNDSSFKVSAVEITNKNIIKDRAVFGKNFNDVEKIALESLAIDEIKASMYNEDNFEEARDVVEEYYEELAKEFGVTLSFK